jgi:hypothetical protein
VLLPPKEQSAIQLEKHIPSSFIRKEDAEPEVVATRVECIGAFQAFHQSSENFKGSEDKQVERDIYIIRLSPKT